MNADMIMSTLREAILYILGESGFKSVSVDTLSFGNKPSELVVTTGITGSIKGILMVKFSIQDAVTIARTMLATIDHAPTGSALSESHKGALSEIANMFTGRFLNLLSVKDIDCNLTPPSIITGTEISVTIRNIEYSIDLAIRGISWIFYISLFVMRM